MKETLSFNAFHLISRNKNEDLRSIISDKFTVNLNFVYMQYAYQSEYSHSSILALYNFEK